MESEYAFNVLFPFGTEHICFSKDTYGTKLYDPDEYGALDLEQYSYFSINAMRDTRKDANVTCYRNILLEFDGISQSAQEELMESIPKSVVTWSGGKSYHCIISLAVPCESREEYDRLVKRIYDRVPEADRAAKNPSRFSRTPGAKRNNGKTQHLISVGTHITAHQLEHWLGPDVRPEEPKKLDYAPTGKRLLSGYTKYFLDFGAKEGSWNKSLYLATLDMVRSGLPEAEIFDRLVTVTGKLDASDRRTINSALKTARTE